ncbi:MAG: OsmC family protein [Candidatus Eremiobacteraeota bacterium]|nr:OsmC family protein [Candidatus Eremiobacteraeota bacterium]
MAKEHQYQTTLRWTGNRGEGTTNYRSYDRAHEISAPGKPPILGSSDPGFRGDASRWNPEQLLVASLSACHKLWYLHLCSTNGIVVQNYTDEAEGAMNENKDGSGEFTRVVLHPVVEVSPESDRALAEALHHKAHDMCFIARSVNFSVECKPTIV